MSGVTWYPVEGNRNKLIGAIGFVGGKAAIVASFHKDADANRDGNVSIGEWLGDFLSPISSNGRATVEVAMYALYDIKLMARDPSFANVVKSMFLNHFRMMIIDGIYAAYFKLPVRFGAGAVVKGVIKGKVLQFAVRKGMETVVEKAMKTVMHAH